MTKSRTAPAQPADTPRHEQAPDNVVVILLDSLNRHMIGPYGNTEYATPNLDRLSRRSIRFTKHYTGSLPCIPARHDILCGAIDFLWRPWGSIELWEEAITAQLEKADIATMLISDHPHLFETGGENYHTDFLAWEYLRGHEGDPWKTRPDPSWMGAPLLGSLPVPYDRSRGYFQGEDDFPGPRTMRAAAEWLTDHAPHHDRFFLFIDEFDPHEPFDTPEPYASMYDSDWEGAHLIWPIYSPDAVASGKLTERQAFQIRAQYAGKLTMIDDWLGKVLDALDNNRLWDNTAVILVTDHGHYLGERDIFGKPAVPIFEQMGHIPLMVSWPGRAPGSVDALTTAVDIFATLCDVFDVTVEHRTHGRSLVPLITGSSASVRDHLLCGVWGREVQIVDDTHKYTRAPDGGNHPISMWSNRWSTMPVRHGTNTAFPNPDDRAFLDKMPGSAVPVIRQPWQPGDLLPYWAKAEFEGNFLYNVDLDPNEAENRIGGGEEAEYADLLHDALTEIDAPDDQFARLGYT